MCGHLQTVPPLFRCDIDWVYTFVLLASRGKIKEESSTYAVIERKPKKKPRKTKVCIEKLNSSECVSRAIYHDSMVYWLGKIYIPFCSWSFWSIWIEWSLSLVLRTSFSLPSGRVYVYSVSIRRIWYIIYIFILNSHVVHAGDYIPFHSFYSHGLDSMAVTLWDENSPETINKMIDLVWGKNG